MPVEWALKLTQLRDAHAAIEDPCTSCFLSVRFQACSTCMLCRVYELYTDYVLKNPFYEMEMPIRCELFDTNLIGTILNMNRRWGVVVQPTAVS